MKKIFIGIDVSKETVDVSFVSSDFQSTPEYLAQYSNDSSGYRAMVRDLRAVLPGVSSGQWLFCCETTGAYDRRLCHWLVDHGLLIWRESALQIKQSLGIRRGKNDKTDSMAIADYARRHPDKFVAFAKPSGQMAALKDLYLYRQTLADRIKSCKNRIKAIRSQGASASAASSFILRDIKSEMSRLEQSLKKCERAMEEAIGSDPRLEKNYRHLKSIKGFGLVLSVALMVFSGNFETVATANKMATYCGIASFRKVSGSTLDAREDVSSLSNRRLKGMLTMAARCSIRYDTAMRRYFEAKTAQGKPYGVAINNVKNKLIHLAYALVANDCDYDPNHANGWQQASAAL